MYLNVSCTTGLKICIVLRLVQFTICPDWGTTGLNLSWGKAVDKKIALKSMGILVEGGQTTYENAFLVAAPVLWNDPPCHPTPDICSPLGKPLKPGFSTNLSDPGEYSPPLVDFTIGLIANLYFVFHI